MGRIDLTGTYPTGEGAVLQVQRATGPGDDSWVDFPVTVTVSGGQFSTYVQTGRTGPNRFRVIDTDSDAVVERRHDHHRLISGDGSDASADGSD